MTNGLTIKIADFKNLSTKEQVYILYQNTEEIKQLITGYKFQMKVQYFWLSLLTIVVLGQRFLVF